jgi:hypothetical protein
MTFLLVIVFFLAGLLTGMLAVLRAPRDRVERLSALLFRKGRG